MDSDSSLDEPTQGPQSPEHESHSSPGDLNNGSDSDESDNEETDRTPVAPPGLAGDSSPFGDRSPGRNRSPVQHQNIVRNESPFSDRSLERNKSPFGDRSPVRNKSPSDGNTVGDQSPFGNRSPIRNKSPVESRSPVKSDKSPVEKESATNRDRTPSRSSPLGKTGVDDKKEIASPKHSDNDGELSDSSNDSRSSSSSSSSNRSEGGGGEVLQLAAPGTPVPMVGHGEDLSDVSDLDSNEDRDSLDGTSEEEGPTPPPPPPAPAKKDQLIGEDVELDFEADEAQDREEGECADERGGGASRGPEEGEDEGEIKGEDLEEGEVTDDEENRPEETEPRPVCRFYNRGQCTWGASCRFLHPGVTDKGNYTMFDMVRPLVPMNGPAMYTQPVDFRAPYEKPVHAMYPAGRKEDTPVFETSWERGLRQAKELLRKSTKRKETDMDFEEKKMNLSIGQEELDKENDYYTRPASPILNDETWGMKPIEPESKYHREAAVAPRYEEFPEPSYYPHARGRETAAWGGDYNRRVHYERTDAGYGRGNKYHNAGSHHQQQHRQPIPDFYDKYDDTPPTPVAKKKRHPPAREVTVQRVSSSDKPWRGDERYADEATSSRRSRGDEWADPWMRSKSPGGRKGVVARPTRRQSYSSGSSYSSSSSSRSGSSASSYSSYSHNSRSRSRSKSRSRSGSHSPPIPRSARRKPVERNRTPPGLSQRKPTKTMDMRLQGKGKLPSTTQLLSEKKAATDRLMCMNPPAPSPRNKQKDPRDLRPPSPGMMRKSAQNPPPPLAGPRTASGGPGRAGGGPERSKAVLASALVAKAAKLQRRLRSSRSTSGSESSGSSSESSESSYSSSSSSRDASPKAVRPPKRIIIDERERLALAQKVKAMDALKLSGQKPQIKLTLKTPNSNTAAAAKRSATGLPELPELNLVRRDRPPAPTVAGKKRPAGDDPDDAATAAKVAAMSKPLAKQKATSRREELLKQLKAVEDAIARKRSKV